jgi:hypothetical protein
VVLNGESLAPRGNEHRSGALFPVHDSKIS